MITLTIMNDQADAVLPELDALRAEYVERLSTLPDGQGAEETRLTRALAIVSNIVGQIRVQKREQKKSPVADRHGPSRR